MRTLGDAMMQCHLASVLHDLLHGLFQLKRSSETLDHMSQSPIVGQRKRKGNYSQEGSVADGG